MVPQIVFDNGVALGAYEPRHTTWGPPACARPACPRAASASRRCTPSPCPGPRDRARRDDDTVPTSTGPSSTCTPGSPPGTAGCTPPATPRAPGSVTVFHPWESGLDNSPRWDEALANVPMRVDSPGSRPDLAHVADAAERPTDDEYRRYFTLVRELVDVDYDPARSHRTHPFRMADVLFTAILAAADDELAELAVVPGSRPRPSGHRADAEPQPAGPRRLLGPRPLRLPRPRPGRRPAGGRRHDRRVRPAGGGVRRRPRRGAGPPAARPELRRRRGAALGRAAHHGGDRPGVRPPLVLAGADPARHHLVAVVGPRSRRPPHPGRQAPHGRAGAAAHRRLQRVRRPVSGEPLGSTAQSWTAAVALDWLAHDRWPPPTWCPRPGGVDVAAGAGFGLFFTLIMAVSVGGLAFWVVALVDCIRRPEIVYRVAGTEKVTWVLIVALAGWIGGLIYWFSQRASAGDRTHGGRRLRPTYVAPHPGYASGPPVTPPGWYPDPQGPGLRWWDGQRWTEHVADRRGP